MILLGQIGTGNWGIKLLNAMNRVATVKSCYGHQNRDLVPRNVKIVDDPGDIISDKELDGVIIASSPESHYALARKCLECGQNLFIEKPLCTDTKEAQVLFELSHAKEFKLLVGFVYLYSNEYERIKQASLGIDHIEAYFMKANDRHNIPCMLELGSHFVALALDFYGEDAASVALSGDDEDAVVDITFPSGSATIHASYKSESQRRDVLFMREKKLICSWNALRSSYKTDSPLVNECKHFIDCIQCDVKPRADALLGLKVAKLVEGMLP